MSDQSDKTEKPTPKRLKASREEGQVARSKDLNLAFSSLTATAMLVWFGPTLVGRLREATAKQLSAVATIAKHDISSQELTNIVIANAALIGLVVGPIALAAAIAGVFAAGMQGGIRFTPKAMAPDITKLNPANGLKRLAPSQSWLDMIKTLITVVILGTLAYQIGKGLTTSSVRFPWMTPVGAAGEGWSSISRLLWQTGFAILFLSGADYALQRWRLMKTLKMSVQDVRDESKSNDGSPEMKARVRKVQREMSRNRMMADTAKATVVITNPTHYAVALKYDRDKHPAPIVVAKGKDELALRIREVARKHGVPIIENPPLARALHAGSEVGDAIPSGLFGAVAEVLGYLIRIKQLML